jgi:hypothetical protein
MKMKRGSVRGAFWMCSFQLLLPAGASPTESDGSGCFVLISYLFGSALLPLPSSLSRRGTQLEATGPVAFLLYFSGRREVGKYHLLLQDNIQSGVSPKGLSESRTIFAVEKWGAKDNSRKHGSKIFRPTSFDRLRSVAPKGSGLFDDGLEAF